jgi:hypothetical protein
MRPSILALILSGLVCDPVAGDQPSRQDHRRLKSYMDGAGNDQPVTSREGWAIAPRPLFSNSPLRDDNFDVVGVEKAAPVVREVYRLLGATRALRIATPDSDHNFPDAVRQEAYEFLERYLLAD